MNESTSKKGAALIYVVLLGAMIIILGMVLLNISSNSHKLSVEETKQEQAYLSSKSGLNYFLNSLKGENNDALQSLKDAVKASNLQNTAIISDEVGDITIKLTNVDDYKFQIDSVSSIYGTSATTTAFLEKSELLGGFDWTDKPFYVYNEYDSSSSDVEFGSYKGTLNNKKPYISFKDDYKDYPNEADQYGIIDAEVVNLTQQISDALTTLNGVVPGINACTFKDTPMQTSTNKDEDPFANDIYQHNCTLNYIPDTDITISYFNDKNKLTTTTRDGKTVWFDFYYFENNEITYYYQDLIYVSPIDDTLGKILIGGENFYSQDVVYLTLRDPNDLSQLEIVDTDSTGSYHTTGSGTISRDPDGNAASTSEDGYVYVGGSDDYFNDIVNNELLNNPIGADILDLSSYDLSETYTYGLDSDNSNNFIILIDNIDSSYATTSISIDHDLDAWVYAPDYTVTVKSGVNLTGGIIANKVIVESGATIDGRHPNEGFDNMLKSSYTDKFWRVVYE
jgi:hypothetical protein